jgi:DNA repair protein RadC
MDSESPLYGGHRQRLRDRFLRAGFAGFAEHEVVELLLTLCIPRRDVKSCAKALLVRFGSLRAILDAPTSELQHVTGIGAVAPVALRIIREAANLYLQQRAEGAIVLASSDALKAFWRSRLGGLRNEVFEVAYLDSASRLMRDGVEVLEQGTVDRAAVYPRRVMEAALQRGAAALVVAHNHPNGNVSPSEQDKVLTKALVLAATALQVKLVDHLIVSADEVFSFREAGLL